MRKGELESYLAERLTLREIGDRTGKHLTTVSYWIKRHGLRAANANKFAPKFSAITKERLKELVDRGASLADLSEVLGLSVSTVRHWLKKYGLQTAGVGWRGQQSSQAREAGLKHITRSCTHHGMTAFVLEGRGYYRCSKCRREAVSRWRRRAKLRLIEAAGGSCVLCGYDRHPSALHFHHLDPTQKRYTLSRAGHTRNYAEALEEAKKCVLLCANCHAEVERGMAQIPDELLIDAQGLGR
jgi:DNA-binding transcriptional ArsR family regulator